MSKKPTIYSPPESLERRLAFNGTVQNEALCGHFRLRRCGASGASSAGISLRKREGSQSRRTPPPSLSMAPQPSKSPRGWELSGCGAIYSHPRGHLSGGGGNPTAVGTGSWGLETTQGVSLQLGGSPGSLGPGMGLNPQSQAGMEATEERPPHQDGLRSRPVSRCVKLQESCFSPPLGISHPRGVSGLH